MGDEELEGVVRKEDCRKLLRKIWLWAWKIKKLSEETIWGWLHEEGKFRE